MCCSGVGKERGEKELSGLNGVYDTGDSDKRYEGLSDGVFFFSVATAGDLLPGETSWTEAWERTLSTSRVDDCWTTSPRSSFAPVGSFAQRPLFQRHIATGGRLQCWTFELGGNVSRCYVVPSPPHDPSIVCGTSECSVLALMSSLESSGLHSAPQPL